MELLCSGNYKKLYTNNLSQNADNRHIEAHASTVENNKKQTNCSSIDKSIIPTLSGKYKTVHDIKETLCERVAYIQIIGSGGSGKTFILYLLMEELENCGMNVFYWPVNYEYISSDEWANRTENVDVLIVDGINEIERNKQELRIKEMEETYKNKSVSIIFTSRREIDEMLCLVEFEKCMVNSLDKNVVKDYLASHLDNGVDDSMFNLLSTPMMLTLFCNTNNEKNKIKDILYFQFCSKYSKTGEIIHDYLESITAKYYMGVNRNKVELIKVLCIRTIVLPEIAFLMNKEGKMFVEKTTLVKYLSHCVDLIKQRKDYIFNYFIERELDFYEIETWISTLNFLIFLKDNQAVFTSNGNKWGFIHQNYRDELTAEKIAFDFNYNESEIPESILEKIDYEVLEFLGDLVFLFENGIEFALDRLRGKIQSETKNALYNIIETLKKSRGNIAGMDLSSLDLKNLILYPYIDGNNGIIQTSFDNTNVYKENFFPIGHDARVVKVCFDSNGILFATASDNGTIIIAEIETANIVKKINIKRVDFCSGLCFSKDNRYLAFSHFRGVIVFDAKTGDEMYRLEVEYDIVDSITFHPLSYTILVAIQNCEIFLWDFENDKKNILLADAANSIGNVSAVFSKDGMQVLTGYASGEIRIWNIQDNSVFFEATYVKEKVRDIKYSNNGQMIGIAYENGQICIINIKSGSNIIISGHSKWCFMINFSLDDKSLVSASADCSVKVWNTQNGELRNELKGHKEFVQVAMYSSDGDYIVSSDCEGIIKIWNAHTLNLKFTLEEHKDIVGALLVHPKKPVFISVSLDENVIIWNALSGKMIKKIRNIGKRIADYMVCGQYISVIDEPELFLRTWSRDNKCIFERYVGYSAKFVDEYNFCTWKNEEITLLSTLNGKEIWRYSAGELINSVVISNTGAYIAIIQKNRHFNILEIQSGCCIYENAMEQNSLSFSPQDNYCAFKAEKEIKLYEFAQSDTRSIYSLNENCYLKLSFSYDEKFFYVSSIHGNISVYEIWNDTYYDDELNCWNSYIDKNNTLVLGVLESSEIFLIEGIKMNQIKNLSDKIRYIVQDKKQNYVLIENNESIVTIVEKKSCKIVKQFEIPQESWSVKFEEENIISFSVGPCLILYNLITEKKTTILNQEYDKRLLGCELKEAIFENNIREDEKKILLSYSLN